MEGQGLFAVTVICLDAPAVPVTVKLPLRLPLALIVAKPDTPVPLTEAPPAGAPTSGPQTQPEPLSAPLTIGAGPLEGLRESAGARAATGRAWERSATARRTMKGA
jgi:hypothetical protein